MEQTDIEVVPEFVLGQCLQSLNFETAEQLRRRLPGYGGITVNLIADVVDANVSRRPKDIVKEQ